MFKKPKGGTGGGGLFGLLETGGKIAIPVEVACFGVLYCGYRYISGIHYSCDSNCRSDANGSNGLKVLSCNGSIRRHGEIYGRQHGLN